VAEKASMAGWIAFAAFLMIIIGVVDMLQGLTAIIRDQYYVHGNNGSLVIDVSQWGWIMLILGAALVFVGYGLLQGASWARWFAILGVGLNFLAVLSFDGAAGFSLWSLCAIALNILVLYALMARWQESKAVLTGPQP
jgi:predicted membrane metal-binding protein